ncbi:unnamed protein product [Cyprideis torosa]|uniref:Uncharacterized protein n=1 Tax=Cyprideis torosa TaxID=163714 RepID=A0A7R8ZJI7_9CRUS|nr:unnamed protein product [Cyprideis torosa]CAG0882344.1 unnamed protein product [Cyprideis torosa]
MARDTFLTVVFSDETVAEDVVIANEEDRSLSSSILCWRRWNSVTREGRALAMSSISSSGGPKEVGTEVVVLEGRQDSRVTQLLKECIGSLTCHAAVIAHVNGDPRHYSETLTTVQVASRIHRTRRKKMRGRSLGSAGSSSSGGRRSRRSRGGNSSGGEGSSRSGSGLSSSELSCDTVIYCGQGDEGRSSSCCDTDVEGIPRRPTRRRATTSPLQRIRETVSEERTPSHHRLMGMGGSHREITTGPVFNATKPPVAPKPVSLTSHEQEELWIDGPRFSRSQGLVKTKRTSPTEIREAQLCVNGRSVSGNLRSPPPVPCPMAITNRGMPPVGTRSQSAPPQGAVAGYGFMDDHKKNMIEAWIQRQAHELSSEVWIDGDGQVKKHTETAIATSSVCNVSLSPLGSPPAVQGTVHHRILSPATNASKDQEESSNVEETILLVDCSTQVTEEEIAWSQGLTPLQEESGEYEPRDHPLRVLSQENLSIVSTLTDGISVCEEAFNHDNRDLLPTSDQFREEFLQAWRTEYLNQPKFSLPLLEGSSCMSAEPTQELLFQPTTSALTSPLSSFALPPPPVQPPPQSPSLPPIHHPLFISLRNSSEECTSPPQTLPSSASSSPPERTESGDVSSPSILKKGKSASFNTLSSGTDHTLSSLGTIGSEGYDSGHDSGLGLKGMIPRRALLPIGGKNAPSSTEKKRVSDGKTGRCGSGSSGNSSQDSEEEEKKGSLPEMKSKGSGPPLQTHL